MPFSKVLGGEVGFVGKYLSVFLALLLVYWQSKIYSKGWYYYQKKHGVVAIVELKRHVIGTGIFSIIICKFSHW